ncbi:hypothetical protein [Sphingobium xenophagum]|uniref:Uncharacterized protein n=1 Tax=Sphingobium xenophagum TaxID=121428 RepID=A0A401J3A5_SPHXE|nr:hypothetical protein [Sphingobium xenophagum]GBH31085.1 hypothetical protein MBESOW_P2346 [Sphingobium xenophagum]
MNEKVSQILFQIHQLEQDLRDEMAQAPSPPQILEKIRRLEGDLLLEQRALRTRLLSYIAGAQLSSIVTAPVIYSMVIPILLLDLWATLFQHICFRAYKIPRVRRSDFIVIDRQYLPYLNLLEKLNCLYCGYGNGVIAYVREIASKTEQYWCPIKHAKLPLGTHHRYSGFADYGDGAVYRERLEALRASVRSSEGSSPTSCD